MTQLATKETKHRSTIAPFECEHCGHIWYGGATTHRSAPDTTLCSSCWCSLDDYLYKKYGDKCGRSDLHKTVLDDAKVWIQDTSNKPYRRPTSKIFHRSVPKWLRSAIISGLVKTNGKEVYVVYSRGQEAVRVELADRSSLKPFFPNRGDV